MIASSPSGSQFQSTHPRGVRPSLRAADAAPTMFQSTHPRGVRRRFSFLFSSTFRFQSTHPRGVRLIILCDVRQNFISFNPRTHEGCDRFTLNLSHDLQVSIHAPTVRLIMKIVYVPPVFVSIHAPTRGATYFSAWPCCGRAVSIHAPTRGATAYSAKYRILIYKSSHFANINQTITFKVIKSLEFL